MNKKNKILIIEDDADLVETIALVLEAKNYQVLKAYDTATGMEIIKQEKPELIILDVMFGKKGKAEGFDLAVKIRNDKSISHILILILTSVNETYPGFDFSPETDDKFLPVDEFVNKPAHPNELLEKVEKLLQLKTSKWAN